MTDKARKSISEVRGLSYQITDARLVWNTEPIEESIDQCLDRQPGNGYGS